MRVYVGDYRPDLDKSRLSVRIAKYLLANWIAPEGKDSFVASFCHDMFGVIAPEEKLFDFPKKDNTDLITASLERAREIGPCTVAWSGGVDSSFLLACFAHEGIPVTTATYMIESNHIKPNVFDFVKNTFGNQEFDRSIVVDNDMFEDPIIKIPERSDIEVVTGAWSDALFFPNQRLKGEMSWIFDEKIRRIVTYTPKKYIGLRDLMLKTYDKGRRVFTDEEVEQVCNYAKMFDYKLKTNIDTARFLSFISIMPFYLHNGNIGYHPKSICFFRTQKFIDIAYTQYWHANKDMSYPKNKKIMVDFIHKVFGKQFVTSSNW